MNKSAETKRTGGWVIAIRLAIIVTLLWLAQSMPRLMGSSALRRGGPPAHGASADGTWHRPPVEEEVDRGSAVDYAAGIIDFRLLRWTRNDRDGRPEFPPELAALDGKPVQMVGFMTPYDDLDRMNSFMLFPFPVGCFFCAPPSALEVALVRQRRTDDAPFIDEPILVEGELRLWTPHNPDPGHQEGFAYIIDAAKVSAYRRPR